MPLSTGEGPISRKVRAPSACSAVRPSWKRTVPAACRTQYSGPLSSAVQARPVWSEISGRVGIR